MKGHLTMTTPTTPTVDDGDSGTTLEVRDAGFETVELLTWGAMMVVAIVAISALLQALGVDVINYVRGLIGV
jgi:hypothetical protein